MITSRYTIYLTDQKQRRKYHRSYLLDVRSYRLLNELGIGSNR